MESNRLRQKTKRDRIGKVVEASVESEQSEHLLMGNWNLFLLLSPSVPGQPARFVNRERHGHNQPRTSSSPVMNERCRIWASRSICLASTSSRPERQPRRSYQSSGIPASSTLRWGM